MNNIAYFVGRPVEAAYLLVFTFFEREFST